MRWLFQDGSFWRIVLQVRQIVKTTGARSQIKLRGLNFSVDMGWFCTLLIVGSDLHHSCGQVGADSGNAVRAADPGVAGEDMGAALLAAQHSPFGEHRHTVKCHRPAIAYCAVRQDPVIESSIHAVVIPVKSHRLYIYISIEQFCAPDLSASALVQHILRSSG